MTPHCQWTASPDGASSAAAPAARRLEGTPAVPACDRPRWTDQAAARRWVGGQTRSAEAVSGYRARCRGTVPRPPDPRRTAAGIRSVRPTTRPGREPNPTGRPVRGASPAIFDWPRDRARMSIGTGRGESPAQPPRSAERGRRSPHACWVRLVTGRASPRYPVESSRSRPSPPPLSPGELPPRPHRSGPGECRPLTERSLCGYASFASDTIPRRVHVWSLDTSFTFRPISR
jgi:hypothetical protein